MTDLGVDGLDEEGHVNARHAFLLEPRSIGNAAPGRGVGKVGEADLVDCPAFTADGDLHVHRECAKRLVVGSLDLDGLVVNKLAIGEDLILLIGSELDL